MSNGSFWTAQQWQQFNGVPGDKAQPGLLKSTMGPIEIAQQVFPTTPTGNDNPIPADTIDEHGEPSTGITRGMASLRKSFTLYPVHVTDPNLIVASNQVTLAAQACAMLEESLFYSGKDAHVPAGIRISDADKNKLDTGLLGIAHKNAIDIPHKANHPYGLETYKAVVRGIQKFRQNLQGPPYALILSADTYADANLPLDDTLVTPVSAIQPLLSSGPFVMSPGVPEKRGLLASLGGKATTLYIGTGPLVEYNAYDGSVYSFTARESIQFLNIDSRSLIELIFLP